MSNPSHSYFQATARPAGSANTSATVARSPRRPRSATANTRSLHRAIHGRAEYQNGPYAPRKPSSDWPRGNTLGGRAAANAAR